MKYSEMHDTARILTVRAKAHRLAGHISLAEQDEAMLRDMERLVRERDELRGLLASVTDSRNTFDTAIVLHKRIEEALAKLEEK